MFPRSAIGLSVDGSTSQQKSSPARDAGGGLERLVLERLCSDPRVGDRLRIDTRRGRGRRWQDWKSPKGRRDPVLSVLFHRAGAEGDLDLD